MFGIFLSTSKCPSGKWGWSAVISQPGTNREISGVCKEGETEGLLFALLAAMQALVTFPIGTPLEITTRSPLFASLINLGSTRWGSYSWRKEAGVVAAECPAWRKLAKASKRFFIKGRTPESIVDFEMLGRADHYAFCALSPGRVYKLFTDGSFVPKNKAGGWAAILEDGKQSREVFGSMYCRDCNQAELTAVNKGLALLNDGHSAIVFTDSKFVVTGTRILDVWIESNWRTLEKRRVLHRSLWEDLRDHMDRLSVRIEWIKGHSGIEQNVRADFLANREAKAFSQDNLVTLAG